MDRNLKPDREGRPDRMVPAGGVPLGDEQRSSLLSQWEGAYRAIRQMDTLDLSETEPATIFVWEEPLQ